MAEVSILETVQGAPSARAPGRRGSCNACSDAKVRCTKERPTCTRCARRSDSCIYAVTRRVGRRPRVAGRPTSDAASTSILVRSPQATPPQQVSSVIATPDAPISLREPDDTSIQTSAIHHNFDSDLSSISTAFTTDVTTPMLMSAACESDLDNIFASIAPFLPSEQLALDSGPNVELDSSTTSSWPRMHEMTQNNDDDVRQLLDPVNHSPPTIEAPTLAPNWTSSNTSSVAHFSSDAHSPDLTIDNSHPNTDSLRSSAKCNCPSNTLTLLARLTPPDWKGSSSDSVAGEMPIPFEEVLARNEAALATVEDVLKCSSPHDGTLLFTMSMVILKTLGWYSAAVSIQENVSQSGSPIPDHSKSLVSKLVQPQTTNFSIPDESGEGASRLACQIILSKMYSVHRVASQLSTQLLNVEEETRKRGATGSERRATNAAQQLLYEEPMFKPAASGGLGSNLAWNLRSHLREVSQGIVNLIQEL